MRGEQSPNGLHYAREHLSCKNYMTDIDTGFKYIKFDTEKCIEEEYTHKNYLLFFLEGDFSVYCNQFCNRTFHSNEMVVLPKSSMIFPQQTNPKCWLWHLIYLKATVTNFYFKV